VRVLARHEMTREGSLQGQNRDEVCRLTCSSKHAEVPITARTRRAQDTGGGGVLVLGKSPTPCITMELAREKGGGEGGARIISNYIWGCVVVRERERERM
jgi:hypothetical protein